jgi:hypothetical protein
MSAEAPLPRVCGGRFGRPPAAHFQSFHARRELVKDSHEDSFARRSACPCVETILALGSGSLTPRAREQANTHLLACDFCGACSQMLSNHTPRESTAHPTARKRMGAPTHSHTRAPLFLLTLALT